MKTKRYTEAHLEEGVSSHIANQVRTAGGLNFLAGLWIIFSPWAFGYFDSNGGGWNSIIVGIVITVLAASRYLGTYQSSWMSWINVLLGLWLVISPWVYGYSDNVGALWNSIIFGLIIFALAIWSALASRGTKERT